MAKKEETVEALIDSKFASLSRSMKKVAAEIRRDWAGVAFLSASRIGHIAGVSEATVHRLAYALEFGGFSEMQEYIKSKVVENRTIVRLKSSTASGRGQAFQPDQVLLMDMDNLQKTVIQEQNYGVWQAADMIRQAGRIYVAGWKASIGVSSFLAYSLNFTLGNALLLSVCELPESVRYMNEQDVFIAVGFPRYSTVTLKGTQMAKKQGAGIIVITDSPISPFCPYADAALFAATASDGFLDSYTAPLSLSNSLVQAVSHLCKDRVLSNLESMEDGLKEFNELHQWNSP